MEKGHTRRRDKHRIETHAERGKMEWRQIRRGEKWSGDTYGKWEHTQKGDIGLIRRGDTHGVGTYTVRETHEVGTHTGSENTHREGHIEKGHREEHNW